MRIDKIPTGDNPPESLNVIIEVPTGGEPVKYEFDKDSGALFVDRDGVVQAPVVLGACVEVAKLGAGDGAAVERLVPELGLDVLAVAARLHLVEDVDDALHGISDVALAKVLLGGQQLDPLLGQTPLGDGSVGVVAEGPGPHVDDDVGDLGVLVEVREQLLEDRTLFDGLCRGARLDELLLHARVDASGAAQAKVALRGNRVPFRVDVDRRVELVGGRDAKVDDGSPRSAADVGGSALGHLLS